VAAGAAEVAGVLYSKSQICAASAVLDKGGAAFLDSLGLIPGENTVIKGVQWGAGILSAALTAFSTDSSPIDGGISGVGLGLSVADSSHYAQNIALKGTEMVPVIGNGLSALSLYRDFYSADGMGAYYGACMEGKN
jgi:hypothetical protein